MDEITLGEVIRLADELSPGDQQSLVEHLTRKLQQSRVGGGAEVQGEHRVPQDLYGIWRGRFPEDIDVDEVLYEIRHEWEKEWPEVFQK